MHAIFNGAIDTILCNVRFTGIYFLDLRGVTLKEMFWSSTIEWRPC